jgi:polyferredoxin
VAPRNAATVFTWVHYRGLLVFGLLAAGNLFCAGCPLVLVRDTARRFFHPALRWPARLRSKWPALALIAGILFAYELFDLWALPWATASLVAGYFAAALLVDTVFGGASFCKYVCPVGQFSFAGSLVSPTELQVRELGTCRTCRTVDCIKGRYGADARLQQRGCELAIFLPLKTGNMDCTLCFDCVRACPHDNIGLFTRAPGAELLDPRRRSGVGRLAARPDIAALVVLFTFGALLNAFAMTAPAARVEQALATVVSTGREAPVLAMLFLGALVVLPLVMLASASTATRGLTRTSGRPVSAVAVAYAYALVPLGLGVWLAHHGFHFLTGALTFVPVLQSAVTDWLGRPLFGEPLWAWIGLPSGFVFPVQLGFVLLGAFGSAALVYGISARDYPTTAFRASLSWLAAVVLLTAAALWIFSQPMDLRGVGSFGSFEAPSC